MDTQTLGYEDFTRLEAKLDAVDKKLDEMLERQRWQKDMVDELAPIAREMVKVGADRLHEMDQAGYFAFGREALRVMQRVVESYSEDDVRLLGDHIVGIMDTVKNVTQPAILSVANETSALLSHSDELEPMGVVDMVKASRDEDVQKGTAIMFEILRQIGRTASDAAAGGAQAPARVAPRSNGKPAKAAPKANGATPKANGAAPKTNGTTAKPAATTAAARGDGWELCEAGHLLDRSQWSETFASAMAQSLGMASLSPEQWAVVTAARAEFDKTQAAPNVRALGEAAGVPTKELYRLFPKAPARTVAKIAGLPKPAGCI